MTLLENHLEQISLSSAAIAELPFPSPKIFTNALLHSHDITALIRDTEAHERALFTIAPSDQISRSSTASIARRTTVHGLNGAGEHYSNSGAFMRTHRSGSAVATLLGGELGEQIRKEGAKESKERGEVDVNLLLKGAEKLCGVYPVPGTLERIASLRSRYEQLNSSISRYESTISKQMAQLARINKYKDDEGVYNENEDEDIDEHSDEADGLEDLHVTEEDLKREDEEIRELEKKKRALEDRVCGMERDLGGLRR